MIAGGINETAISISQRGGRERGGSSRGTGTKTLGNPILLRGSVINTVVMVVVVATGVKGEVVVVGRTEQTQREETTSTTLELERGAGES